MLFPFIEKTVSGKNIWVRINFPRYWGEWAIFVNTFQKIKDALVYQPPKEPARFVLDETDHEGQAAIPAGAEAEQKKSVREFNALLRYSRRLAAFMEKTLSILHAGQWEKRADELQAEYQALDQQQAELNAIRLAYESYPGRNAERSVSTSLEENLNTIRELYKLPVNKDIIIRNLIIPAVHPVKAALVYTDGLVDKTLINLSVMQPLMLLGGVEQNLYAGDLVKIVMERCLPSGQVMRITSFRQIQDAINSGDSVLFFDGIGEVLAMETKGFEHRSIDRPTNEQTIRGSQNAFTEVLRVNTALVRSMLHVSDLVTEIIPVGERGRVNCAVMYIESIANPKLVAEIKRRIKGINVDVIVASGSLEHFIVDAPKNPFPQTLSTERPDRVVAHLAEGRVGILLDGNPFAHIVPISLFTLLHAADDFGLNLYYVNTLRAVRLAGAFLSMQLPALYLAICTFHQEALPTDLLLTITAARAQVPFPTIIEILLMELSFELIREGGLRIPGVLGPTIGIVGAIILGQAAVAAKLVSPIMVIIIAVTGLASYSVPDYRLSSSLRMFRFGFVILAAALGLIGIAGGFLVLVAVLCSFKSFGMPYLAPVAPKTTPVGDVVLRTPLSGMKRRPDELNPQDDYRQTPDSRPWRNQKPTGGKKP